MTSAAAAQNRLIITSAPSVRPPEGGRDASGRWHSGSDVFYDATAQRGTIASMGPHSDPERQSSWRSRATDVCRYNAHYFPIRPHWRVDSSVDETHEGRSGTAPECGPGATAQERLAPPYNQGDLFWAKPGKKEAFFCGVWSGATTAALASMLHLGPGAVPLAATQGATIGALMASCTILATSSVLLPIWQRLGLEKGGLDSDSIRSADAETPQAVGSAEPGVSTSLQHRVARGAARHLMFLPVFLLALQISERALQTARMPIDSLIKKEGPETYVLLGGAYARLLLGGVIGPILEESVFRDMFARRYSDFILRRSSKAAPGETRPFWLNNTLMFRTVNAIAFGLPHMLNEHRHAVVQSVVTAQLAGPWMDAFAQGGVPEAIGAHMAHNLAAFGWELSGLRKT